MQEGPAKMSTLHLSLSVSNVAPPNSAAWLTVWLLQAKRTKSKKHWSQNPDDSWESWEISSFYRSITDMEGFKSLLDVRLRYIQIFFLLSYLSLSTTRLLVASLLAPDVLQHFERATIKIMRSVYKFSLCFSSWGDRLWPSFPSQETPEMTNTKLKEELRDAGTVNQQASLTEQPPLQSPASMLFWSLG